MTGPNDGTTDALLGEEFPGEAVEKAANRLKQMDSEFEVKPQHDSRTALNAAGTGETMKTNHSVVAHVPRDRARDFERAARSVMELGVEITKETENKNGEMKITLRPYGTESEEEVDTTPL